MGAMCRAYCAAQRLCVIGDCAQPQRFAARFRDGGGNHRPVRIVNARRSQGLARLHQFVACGQDRDARFSPDRRTV